MPHAKRATSVPPIRKPRGPVPALALVIAVCAFMVARPAMMARTGHAVVPVTDGARSSIFLPQLLAGRPVAFDYRVKGVLQAGRMRAIAQRGDRVYAIVGTDIVVIGITDVRRPRVIGRVPAVGAPSDLAVAAGRLTAVRIEGRGFAYLDTYDLADPDQPRPAGNVLVGGRGPYGQMPSLFAYGDYVLVSHSCHYLAVVDARGPGPARVVSSATEVGYLEAVVGPVAILHTGHCSPADPPSSLVTVDLRDPLHPRGTGVLPRGEGPHDDFAQIVGVRNTPFGVVFRRSYPEPAAELLAVAEDGAIRQTGAGLLDPAFLRAVTDSTGHLYASYAAGGGSRTEVVSLGTGSAPAWTVDARLASPPRTVASASLGLVALLDANDGTLMAIDARAASAPTQGVDLAVTPFRTAKQVGAAGGLVHVVDWLRTLSVLDYRSDEAAGQRLGRLEPAPWTSVADVAATDSHVYLLNPVLVDGGAGLWAVDISDPARPRLSAAVPGVSGRRLVVAGQRLLVATPAGRSDASRPGLTALSIADPGHPVEQVHLPGNYIDVAAAGRLAATVGPCSDGSGLPCVFAFDLGDPDTARPLAEHRLGGITWQGTSPVVALAGTRAHIAVSTGDTHSVWFTLDLSDPAAPREVESRLLPLPMPTDITVLDDSRLLVSGTEQAVVQVDPLAGSSIAHRFPVSGPAALDGSTAYVAAGEAGLWRLGLGPVRAP